MKEWFTYIDMDVMSWPSKYPDLNRIENVWGMLFRIVYSKGKQYGTFKALDEVIMGVWGTITPFMIQN